MGSLALGLALLARDWRRPDARQWLGLVAIGVLWFAIYNVALNAGERRVDAGTAAMLIQVSPVLVALLAAVFLRERLTPALMIGLVVAFVGVTLIATSTSEQQERDVWGVVLCLIAAAAYAISLVVQKSLVGTLSALQITWTACLVGTLACLPFAPDLLDTVQLATATDVWWVVYLGLFPTAIAFTTYAFALSHMSAGSLSVTTYLVPPITVLMSWVLLGETPPAMAYVGGALCLAGVAVTRRRPKGTPGSGAPAPTARRA